MVTWQGIVPTQNTWFYLIGNVIVATWRFMLQVLWLYHFRTLLSVQSWKKQKWHLAQKAALLTLSLWVPPFGRLMWISWDMKQPLQISLTFNGEWTLLSRSLLICASCRQKSGKLPRIWPRTCFASENQQSGFKLPSDLLPGFWVFGGLSGFTPCAFEGSAFEVPVVTHHNVSQNAGGEGPISVLNPSCTKYW